MRYLGLKDIYEFLKQEEETVVLELLDISSEELVTAFKSKVRERKGYLDKHYEYEAQEEGNYNVPNESLGIGSKQAWQDAGFDLEPEDYR